MSNLSNREEIKRNTSAEPDIYRIQEAYRDTKTDLNPYFGQASRNYNTRNNIWEGKNDKTGKKHGENAFPWDGASDISPFVIDTMINEDVEMMVDALMRANLTAVPVEGGDIERARMISQFMKWLTTSQMKGINRQSRILANYIKERGIGVLGVFWDTKTEESIEVLTAEEIGTQFPELYLAIQDESSDEDTANLLLNLYPSSTKRKMRMAIKDLRKNAIAEITVPKVIYSRPMVKALAVNEDLFFQINTIDLQRAPYIFHSEYYSPEELRAKIETDGWNEDWVEEMIETQVGSRVEDFTNNYNTVTDSFQDRYATNIAAGLIKVIFAYEKATTEDGVPGVFLTAMHPDVDGYGSTGLLGYEPSRYPFVPFVNEYRTQRLMDSRGFPQIAKDFENEIKMQIDSRIDRTTLATCPPREYPLGRKPANWGPGDLLGVRRRGEYGFVETPPFDQGSIEVEQSVRDTLNRMAGRPVDEANAQMSTMMQQGKVNLWLEAWVEVFNQVWDLHQQFGSDREFFRVMGSNQAEPMMLARSEEAEKYDFYLDFSVLNSDATLLLEKLKLAGDVMERFNSSGSSDFDEYKKAVLGAIDVSYAERFIRPTEVATEQEIRQTQDDISKIASGQSVNAPESGNHELRLQVVQSYMQGTEDIPADDIEQRLQEDQYFAARLQKYTDQLQFQIQQKQNAQIGRMGTQPGNALPSA